MSGEKNLGKLIIGMTPILHKGTYVFSTVNDISLIDRKDTVCEFKEKEGTTIVIEQQKADALGLKYDYVAAWLTLTIHSSLKAVGLTALFSSELAKHDVSCNVIAGYYHDHIFVDTKNAEKAMIVISKLSKNSTK